MIPVAGGAVSMIVIDKLIKEYVFFDLLNVLME